MSFIKNDSEQKILLEFQKRVKDLDQDEVTCSRFLIAREFNLELAEEMLRNNIKWRKEIQIENYKNWTLPDVKDDFLFRFTGNNKSGGPVLWLPVGLWKARYWIEHGKKEEVELWSYHILESALIRMKNQNNKQIVAIFGAEELSYYKVAHMDTLKVLYTAFRSLESNYPEILLSLIVVNAPWVFTIAFNFIKPILSPKTLAKIQIFGSDKTKWLPVLRELCPEDAIPIEYLKDS